MNSKLLNRYSIIWRFEKHNLGVPNWIMQFFLLVSLCGCSVAQDENKKNLGISLSDYTQSFVSVDSMNIALVNSKVIDGTGNPLRESQTVLIRNGVITDIGNSGDIDVSNDFYSINLEGKTLIPGLIGMHNHMRIPSDAMLSTSPRLYLACGVTTIETCGTGNPYEEIAIAKSINRGEQPRPEIINSGPYFTGPEGKSNFIRFADEKMVRDTIKYWAKQNIKWLKVYRNTRPQDLTVIVDEAPLPPVCNWWPQQFVRKLQITTMSKNTVSRSRFYY